MTAQPAAVATPTTRWTQLIVGIICMVLIANLQYGWTLFVRPMNQAHGWTVAEDPDRVLDLRRTRDVADAGRRLVRRQVGAPVRSWWSPSAACLSRSAGSSTQADSLTMLYFGAVVSGIGAGSVYATCVGQAVKWFPDRRGLAVGLTAAGFGAGAALTVIPIRAVIAAGGYAAAFFWFGLVQGAIVFVLAWFLRAPQPGEVPSAQAVQGHPVDAELFAAAGAGDAGVLGPLRHVRHGLGKRPDGDRADRADRQGLPCRRHGASSAAAPR